MADEQKNYPPPEEDEDNMDIDIDDLECHEELGDQKNDLTAQDYLEHADLEGFRYKLIKFKEIYPQETVLAWILYIIDHELPLVFLDTLLSVMRGCLQSSDLRTIIYRIVTSDQYTDQEESDLIILLCKYNELREEEYDDITNFYSNLRWLREVERMFRTGGSIEPFAENVGWLIEEYDSKEFLELAFRYNNLEAILLLFEAGANVYAIEYGWYADAPPFIREALDEAHLDEFFINVKRPLPEVPLQNYTFTDCSNPRDMVTMEEFTAESDIIYIGTYRKIQGEDQLVFDCFNREELIGWLNNQARMCIWEGELPRDARPNFPVYRLYNRDYITPYAKYLIENSSARVFFAVFFSRDLVGNIEGIAGQSNVHGTDRVHIYRLVLTLPPPSL